jgi:hypothetical protein
MKLVRNDNPEGTGKYVLINIEKHVTVDAPKTIETIISAVIENNDIVEFGQPNTPDEFFVIKLKDKYACAALTAYAYAAEIDDQEYANEIKELVKRAGINSPFCKTPD